MNKRKNKFQYSDPEIINNLNKNSNSKGKEKIDNFLFENKIFCKNQDFIQNKKKDKNKQAGQFCRAYKVKGKI